MSSTDVALRTTTELQMAPLELAPAADLVARFRSEIDLDDRAKILSYGEPAQRDVASYADKILRDTMAKDSGEVGDLMSDLLLKVKGLDPSSLQKLGFIDRLFGGARAKVEKFKGKFTSLADQVDRVALELERQSDQLKRDVAMLDGLYDRNLTHLRTLEAYIQAGTDYLTTARSEVIPALESNARAAGEGHEAQMAAQRLKDTLDALERLDKRLYDLKLSRTIAMQTMPQIRLIQSGNATLADKLQSSIHTTIPTWKNQMTIALALHRQKEALSLQREVSNTTNEMLKKNAAALRTGSVEIEKESQRGIVDIETLVKVNEELIGTIGDILRIQHEGRDARAKAEGEMRKIETDLKTTLLDAAKTARSTPSA